MGGVAIGGGAGIIVLILSMLFGFNPSDILGGGGSSTGTDTSSNPYAQCTSGADIQANRDCRFVAYTNAIQAFWGKTLSGYQPTTTITYSGVLDTPCGQASNQVGPFFCPTDNHVYLDTSFFDVLTQQLGAKGGDAAEAYVIAHEYGHYISKQIGTLDQVQAAGNQTGPASPQVKLELQASRLLRRRLAGQRHGRPQQPDRLDHPGRRGSRGGRCGLRRRRPHPAEHNGTRRP